MAYFPDLSRYEYVGDAGSDAEPVLNIGWLSSAEAFATARPPNEALLTALLRCALRPSDLCRGVHDCELCDRRSPLRMPAFGREVELGNGEVRALGDGVVFAAPTLIAHYVAAHDYAPPAPFVDAVMRRAASVHVASDAVQRQVGSLDPEDLRAWAVRIAERVVGIATPTPWALHRFEAILEARYQSRAGTIDARVEEVLRLLSVTQHRGTDDERTRAVLRGRVLEMIEIAEPLGVPAQ